MTASTSPFASTARESSDNHRSVSACLLARSSAMLTIWYGDGPPGARFGADQLDLAERHRRSALASDSQCASKIQVRIESKEKGLCDWPPERSSLTPADRMQCGLRFAVETSVESQDVVVDVEGPNIVYEVPTTSTARLSEIDPRVPQPRGTSGTASAP